MLEAKNRQWCSWRSIVDDKSDQVNNSVGGSRGWEE